MIKGISFAILLVISFGINAQQVVIKGNAKTYAGEELKWHCYEDLITYKERELATCVVSEKGDFEFKFNIDETLNSFIHLSVFKGFLFIEPGKEYKIVLPQKVEKLPEDELNPFFKEMEFYVTVLNEDSTGLNNSIKKFDDLYENFLKFAIQKYKGNLNKTVVDSIVTALENSLILKDNKYFNNYKKYKFASLRMATVQRNKEKMIKDNFQNRPILYQNTAYMEVFNQLFTNYLSYLSNTEHGKEIPYFLIKLKSLEKIRSAMDSVEYLTNDTLQELIIAKSLFDNFYKDDYPRESILFMLDSVSKKSSNKENNLIANNILENLTTLLPNYLAPDFDLVNKKGKNVSLVDFKDEFIYLNFINPNSYTCLQELEVLKQMHQRKYELFNIVSICVCKDVKEMKDFVSKNKYDWPFLFYDKNNELLKKYNVKVYPTYYLINPDGKLVMAPAFPPTEETFEARYYDILKSWKKELLKRKSKGKGLNR